MKRANMESFLQHHIARLREESDAVQRLHDRGFSAACEAEIAALAGEIRAERELLEGLMRRAGFPAAPSSGGILSETSSSDAEGDLALRTLEDLILGSRTRELMWRAMANVHFECRQWPDVSFEELANRSRRRAEDTEEKFLLIARSFLSWMNGLR